MSTIYELAFCFCLAATCPEAPTESTEDCKIETATLPTKEVCRDVKRDLSRFLPEGTIFHPIKDCVKVEVRKNEPS